MIELYSLMWWIPQMLGVMAFAMTYLSAWTISRKATIVRAGVAASIFTIQYLFLGLWTAAGVTITDSTRSFLMAFITNRKKLQTIAYIFIIIQLLVFIFITGVGGFNDWVTYLPTAAAIVGTVSFSLISVAKIKALSATAATILVVYFIFTNLWINVAGTIIVVILGVNAYIRAIEEEKNKA